MSPSRARKNLKKNEGLNANLEQNNQPTAAYRLYGISFFIFIGTSTDIAPINWIFL